MFGVLAHPHGAQVYRAISACVKRKVLERDDAGDMLLEVHNVSEWNVLGLVRGAVVSKLFVELSLERSLLHFGLVPGSSQMLQDLYGVWRCYSLCGEELKEFLELKDDDDEDEDGDGGCRLRLVQGSLVTLYQRFEFAKGIPVMLHGAVARAALGQIRASFEDLIVAVWRMQRGDSVLPPLADVILDEIGERLDEGGDEDEASVAAVNEALRRVLQEGEDLFAVEPRVKTNRGDWRSFRVRGTPVRDGLGGVTRIAGSLIDISKRKEAERQLAEERHLIDDRFLAITKAFFALDVKDPGNVRTSASFNF